MRDLATMLATPDDFVRWLEAGDPDRTVGRSRYPHDCPLARYLRARAVRAPWLRAYVGMGGWGGFGDWRLVAWAGVPLPLLGLRVGPEVPLPAWARGVLRFVDRGPEIGRPYTAREVLGYLKARRAAEGRPAEALAAGV